MWQHGLAVQARETDRRGRHLEVLLQAALEAQATAVVRAACGVGGAELFGDRGGATGALQGHLHVEPKLVHRRHGAHVVVAARQRKIRLVVLARRLHRDLRPIDHDLIATQHGRVISGGGHERLKRGVECRQLQILRPAGARGGRPIQQRVQLAFTGGAFLAHAFQLECEDADLRLRLEDILLRGLADRVTALADLEECVEEFVVPGQHVGHRVGVGEPVVRLLDTRDDAESRGVNVLESGVGLARRDRRPQIALARIRQLLADHGADVGRGLLAQARTRQWVTAGVVASRHHRIRKTAFLRRALARGVVPLLRRDDRRVSCERLGDDLGERQASRLRGRGLGRQPDRPEHPRNRAEKSESKTCGTCHIDRRMASCTSARAGAHRRPGRVDSRLTGQPRQAACASPPPRWLPSPPHATT